MSYLDAVIEPKETIGYGESYSCPTTRNGRSCRVHFVDPDLMRVWDDLDWPDAMAVLARLEDGGTERSVVRTWTGPGGVQRTGTFCLRGIQTIERPGLYRRCITAWYDGDGYREVVPVPEPKRTLRSRIMEAFRCSR